MKSPYVGLAFAIAVTAVGLTVALGMRDAPGTATPTPAAHSQAAEAASPMQSKQDKIPSVATMVVGLEEKLAADPADGKGWLLLAKSYHFLGRLEDAREAYRQADALGNGDPTVAAQLFGLSTDLTTTMSGEPQQ
jgi:cytochrome c-type biogenesis protein CcmH